MKPRFVVFYAIAALAALAACDVPDWLGGDEKQAPPLKGDRISVLDFEQKVKVDPSLQDAAMNLPAPDTNSSYTHKLSPIRSGFENLAVTGFTKSASTTIGDGSGWKTSVIAQPVVADGVVYAMDAQGVVSAHKAGDIGTRLWVSEVPVMEDQKDSGGGGLAYANGVLYVTTGYGAVMALLAQDGTLLWHRVVDIPVRAAPVVEENRVFAVTIDNQLLAFEARTGAPLWSHRGIRESAVYLGAVSPAVENGIVIAAYTSGEVYAVRAEDGSALWSDSLIIPRRTSAAAMLTGINATPLIKDNVVYVLGNGGLMAANTLATGNGVWDVEAGGYHTPWIAGEYLFVISSARELMAVNRRTGHVKWITDLKQQQDGKDVTPYLNDPILLNGQVAVVCDNGVMRLFGAADGKEAASVDVADGVRVAPVVAGGVLYLLSSNATLSAYR